MLNIAVGGSDGPFVARYTMERRTVKMKKKRMLTLELKYLVIEGKEQAGRMASFTLLEYHGNHGCQLHQPVELPGLYCGLGLFYKNV